MKLVIDIAEEDYNWIRENHSLPVTNYSTTIRLYDRVANGTPFTEEVPKEEGDDSEV